MMTRSTHFTGGRRESIKVSSGTPVLWSQVRGMGDLGKTVLTNGVQLIPVGHPTMYQRVVPPRYQGQGPQVPSSRYQAQGQQSGWRPSLQQGIPIPPPLPPPSNRPPSVQYLRNPRKPTPVTRVSSGLCSCQLSRHPEGFTLTRFPSTCCCYCCCDSSKKGHKGIPGNNKKQPDKGTKPRNRSQETLGPGAQTTKSKMDVRKLLRNEGPGTQPGKPKFQAVTTLEDVQAIRCAEFHPRGHVYAVGSNSKALRVCAYPDTHHISKNHVTHEPLVLFKRNKHHRGSIYCLGWAPDGNLLATGSNDKTVKLTRFDDTRKEFGNSDEIELTMHDGTIRDLCFIEDLSNKASLLVSGGAGDCKIYVTDCMTSTPFQAFTGHSAPILSLYNWGGVIFASGSQDKTIRLWDLRTRDCVNMISPLTAPNSLTIKSAVGSVAVDPTGRLLISGHEDGAIVLFDIRGNRQIQTFKPYASDVKSVRFSPNAYYLLSAGYDQRLMLTDLQGDLSLPLSSVVVGSHADRVISGRWHPTEFSFLSTSADKTATLWALNPPVQ